MSTIVKRNATLSLIVAATLALALLASPWVASTLSAQSDSEQSASAVTLPRTITVVGQGQVSIVPDMAVATIGVEVGDSSVQEATAKNRAILSEVLASLEAEGVEERDIQTAGFSVYSERFGPEGPLPDDEVTYRVSNNVRVKVRDLDSIGAVLDAAIEAGANNIYGVEFMLDDDDDAKSQAREKALENAVERATEIATLSGVELGSVITVSEIIGGGSGAGFYAELSSRQMGLGGGGNGTIAPGELDIMYQIQVTYGIAD